jgi:hypothetical protein
MSFLTPCSSPFHFAATVNPFATTLYSLRSDATGMESAVFERGRIDHKFNLASITGLLCALTPAWRDPVRGVLQFRITGVRIAPLRKVLLV